MLPLAAFNSGGSFFVKNCIKKELDMQEFYFLKNHFLTTF